MQTLSTISVTDFGSIKAVILSGDVLAGFNKTTRNLSLHKI
jgi:hypothetical protein